MKENFECYIKPEHYVNAFAWCQETFGYSGKWKFLGNNEIGGFAYFEDEEEAAAFKLRWL